MWRQEWEDTQQDGRYVDLVKAVTGLDVLQRPLENTWMAGSLQKMVHGRNHEDLQETSRNLSLSLSIGIYIYINRLATLNILQTSSQIHDEYPEDLHRSASHRIATRIAGCKASFCF
jgi:hypothetical protein